MSGEKTPLPPPFQSAPKGRTWLAPHFLGLVLTQWQGSSRATAELLARPGQRPAEPESPGHRRMGHGGAARCCSLVEEPAGQCERPAREAAPASCPTRALCWCPGSWTAGESARVRGGRRPGWSFRERREVTGKRMGKTKGREAEGAAPETAPWVPLHPGASQLGTPSGDWLPRGAGTGLSTRPPQPLGGPSGWGEVSRPRLSCPASGMNQNPRPHL